MRKSHPAKPSRLYVLYMKLHRYTELRQGKKRLCLEDNTNSTSAFPKEGDLDWSGAKKGSLFYCNCLKYLLVLNNSSSGEKISFNMRKIKKKLKKHKTKIITTAEEGEGEADGSTWGPSSENWPHQQSATKGWFYQPLAMDSRTSHGALFSYYFTSTQFSNFCCNEPHNHSNSLPLQRREEKKKILG